MSTDILTLSQISLYNTQRVTDEQSKMLFVARTRLFKLLMDSICAERKNAPPQHHIIIGQRGMGKTTLLKRLEVELRSKPLCDSFIPLLFPEEQYNLDKLDTFWLNCLDSIADVLEKEGYSSDVAEIDKEVERLSSLPQTEREDNVYRYFRHVVFNLRRRPVLLIDNINFVLSRLTKEEQHTLRSYMTDDSAPIIIGASSLQVPETSDYSAPFYDAFKVHFLKRLSNQELMEILINLATITGQQELKKDIRKMSSRLKALNQLTGGNPRTAVILFKQIVKGFSNDITGDLDGILDDLTPIYKSRFEELSEKSQIIVNAIAMQWDPITLEDIRRDTQMDNGQISPQLKRLMDTGWIEKPKSARGKGGRYEISERLFNIWYLIRRSSRRQKRIVFCLSKFLEAFYESTEDISSLIQRIIPNQFTNDRHAIAALAIAKLIKDKAIRWELHEKARDYIINQSIDKPAILDSFDVSDYFDGEEEHLAALKKNIENKDNEGALFTARLLLNNEPGNAYASLIVARLYLDTEKYEDAFKVIQGVNEKHLAPHVIQLAISLHNKTSFDNPWIETLCKKAVQMDPDDSESYLFLGKFYTENERYEEAIDVLTKGLNHTPDSEMLLGALADAYCGLEDYEKAEKYLSTFDLAKVAEWKNYYNMGIIRFHQQRYSETIDYMRKGLDCQPQAWVCNPWIIISHDMMDNGQMAESSFLNTFGQISNLDGYFALLSEIYAENGIIDRLTAHFEEALKMRPNDVQLRRRLAILYIDENRFTDAKTIVECLLADDSKDEISLLFMGYISWELDENIEKTRSYLLEAAKINESEGLLFLLAIIERNEQNYELSASYFEKALALAPNNVLTMNELSMLYEYKLGNIEKAEHLAMMAVEKKPDYDYYRLVNLYRDGFKNLEAANEYIGRIPEKSRDKDWEFVHRILSRWENGEVDGALAELKEYLTEMVHPEGDIEPTAQYYLYAKCIEFGHGTDLLKAIEDTGAKDDALPEYHAIKALLSSNEDSYFDSVAHEIRDPGLMIARTIDFYVRTVL